MISINELFGSLAGGTGIHLHSPVPPEYEPPPTPPPDLDPDPLPERDPSNPPLPEGDPPARTPPMQA